jgi:DNA-binding Lrp family transcriptional regulator
MDSARPRAGRRFEPTHELALEGDALRAARALPGAHRGLLVLREPAGPFGVPDLLAVVGPRELLLERQALGVPPLLHQVDAGVVAAAAARAPRTVESLAARVGWPVSTVQRRIPGLVRSGALLRTGVASFVRPDALQPIGRLYAIETKIREWKRAVRQARTYSVWNDSYVVVMSSMTMDSVASAAEAVGNDGGGLMVAGEWICRPRLGARSPGNRMWGSEHVLAAAVPPRGA